MSITIDLGREGKYVGYIALDTALGPASLRAPIISIKNGEGPCVVCLAGIHGDEPDGQIVARELANALDVADIRGQLIILPSANTPAAMASTRTSPIDGGDLNRLFPGDPDGSPTQRLADIIERQIIARSDLVIDLHSGGDPAIWLSGPIVIATNDTEEMAFRVSLLEAFGAPHAYVFASAASGASGTPGACERTGSRRMGTEVGGGGVLSMDDVALLRNGVLRVLSRMGVLTAPRMTVPAHVPHILMRGSDPRHRVVAQSDGFFVPSVALGVTVAEGATIGEIILPEDPMAPPVPVIAQLHGLVIMQNARGRFSKGNTLAIIAPPLTH